MSSKFLTILFLIGIRAFCWWMVISSSSRKKFSKSGSHFWRLNKSGEESWDAMMLAAYLVGALFFSMPDTVREKRSTKSHEITPTKFQEKLEF